MAIVLYREPHWVSPYVFSCFVTLTEKGLPFEERPLRADRGETNADDYLARTVTGRVPSLVDGDVGLAESSAIVEYLEDRYPEKRVLPSDVGDRARCRQIMSWLRSDDTVPIREERPSTTIFYSAPRAPLSRRAADSVAKLFRVFERTVGDRTSMFGEWCIADSELAFMLQRLVKGGDQVPDRVRAYVDAQWGRASVEAWVKKPRPAYPG
jgi:glutathione S-transferase